MGKDAVPPHVERTLLSAAFDLEPCALAGEDSSAEIQPNTTKHQPRQGRPIIAQDEVLGTTTKRIQDDIVLSVLAAVAKQERITISERTLAGLERARKSGKVLGRRPVAVDVAQARRLRREGFALRPIAKRMRISVNTLRKALGAATKALDKAA